MNMKVYTDDNYRENYLKQTQQELGGESAQDLINKIGERECIRLLREELNEFNSTPYTLHLIDKLAGDKLI